MLLRDFVTVVTLDDQGLGEHFVGVFGGRLFPEDRQKLARENNARLWHEMSSLEQDQAYEGRYLYFREVGLSFDPNQVQLLNIDDHHPGGDGDSML